MRFGIFDPGTHGPGTKAVFRLGRFLLALAIGLAGAELFLWLNLPLPWMLGSMTACLLAAILRLPIEGIERLRPMMVCVIGVLIGSRFHPEILSQLSSWIPTIVGLLVYTFVYSAIHIPFLYYVGRCDFRTAFCAGVPGGLPEMMQLSEDTGADTRMVALVHGARIFLVVLMLPQIINLVAGVDLGKLTRASLDFGGIPLAAALWVAGTAVAGLFLGRLLRLPAAPMLGPMLLSATIHLTGVSSFEPPSEIVVVAQLILGTLIGCRFAGTPRAMLLRTLGLTAVSTVILFLVTIGMAALMTLFSDQDIVPILLAYAPGGLTEMSLVALSLQIEVAFVVSHHVLRVLLVVVLASTLLGKLIRRAT